MRELIYFVAVLLGCVLVISITASWSMVIPRVGVNFLAGFVFTWIALDVYHSGDIK